MCHALYKVQVNEFVRLLGHVLSEVHSHGLRYQQGHLRRSVHRDVAQDDLVTRLATNNNQRHRRTQSGGE